MILLSGDVSIFADITVKTQCLDPRCVSSLVLAKKSCALLFYFLL